MKTIYCQHDREGLAALKWTIRALGGSKRFAGWVNDSIMGSYMMDVLLPNGLVLRVIWV